mmetsp:Transcript_21312/g.33471  ORF Transcript_21312/g.33471 Transcript_21312/m.33471 type:complete len:161 (+) Transcript_21312:92-574(+)
MAKNSRSRAAAAKSGGAGEAKNEQSESSALLRVQASGRMEDEDGNGDEEQDRSQLSEDSEGEEIDEQLGDRSKEQEGDPDGLVGEEKKVREMLRNVPVSEKTGVKNFSFSHEKRNSVLDFIAGMMAKSYGLARENARLHQRVAQLVEDKARLEKQVSGVS